MPEFRALITSTTSSPQTEKLISRIQQGTAAERDSAIEQLIRSILPIVSGLPNIGRF